MRIQVETVVEHKASILDDNPLYDAIDKAMSELREEAVLKNAEGYESSKIEHKIYQQPYDFSTHILVWMDMIEHA